MWRYKNCSLFKLLANDHAPATIGEAILVPLIIPYLLLGSILIMYSPGDSTDTHLPQLLNFANEPSELYAATVIAPYALAGLTLHASM